MVEYMHIVWGFWYLSVPFLYTELTNETYSALHIIDI